MSPALFWILFLAPAVVLVVFRVARQGRGYRIAYRGRLVFRAALSAVVYALYAAIVWKFWSLSTSNDLDSSERLVRGTLFWLLFYWSVGSFDGDTWRSR